MLRNETMAFQNPTDHTINLDAIGLDPVPPGGQTDVPLELCAPGRADNGKRAKSSLECVAPQLIPVSKTDHEIWKATPAQPPAVSRIVSVSKQAAPVEAPGVKLLREQRETAVKKALEIAEKAKTSEEEPSVQVKG